jgi:hypothetical protein
MALDSKGLVMRRLLVPFAASLLTFAFLAANASADAAWSTFSQDVKNRCDNGGLGATAVSACHYLQGELANPNPYNPNSNGVDQGISAWQVSQAIAAMLDIGNTPAGDVSDATAVLNEYNNNGSYASGLTPYFGSSSGATSFYDDNAWIGQDLVDGYNQSSLSGALIHAVDLYNFERTGEWDAAGHLDGQACNAPPGGCDPGGEWFSTARAGGNGGNGHRNLNATGGAGLLSTELYPNEPGDYSYLFWGESNMEQWTATYLGAGGYPYPTADSAWPSGIHYVFSPYIDNTGHFGTWNTSQSSDNYGESLYMAQFALLYQLCVAGNNPTYQQPPNCNRYLWNGADLLQGMLNNESLSVMESHYSCPAFNAIFFYNAEKLRKVIDANGGSNLLTFFGPIETQFDSTWASYNTYLRNRIDPTTGAWLTGTSLPGDGTFDNSCDPPMPQIGALRSLIDKTKNI